MNARELIEDIRGGVPGKCDFCENETLDHQLHPEEAGDWACIFCILRWDATDMIADNKTMDTEQLNKLATDIHELAKAKGWHSFKETNGQFLTRAHNNMHGEISELWESNRAGTLGTLCDKAEKMREAGLEPLTCAEEELADIVIRVLDSVKRMGSHIRYLQDDGTYAADIADHVENLHNIATETQMSMELAVLQLVRECECTAHDLGIDLWSAVARKHAFNATRPFRHGGKKA